MAGTSDGVAGERPQQRSKPRDSMFLQAELSLADGRRRTCRVRNLSAGGMMADCSDQVTIGEAVSVDLRGIGIVTARIAWTESGRIGIAFDREVDPLLTRQGRRSGNESLLVSRPSLQARRPGFRG